MTPEKGGCNALARVLQERMTTVAVSHSDQTCDLGTIQPDDSLLIDGFPIPLPRGSYLVCRSLRFGETGAEFAQTTENGHEIHVHTVKLPEAMRGLRAGDRVLVCWVNKTPVVVDIVGG